LDARHKRAGPMAGARNGPVGFASKNNHSHER